MKGVGATLIAGGLGDGVYSLAMANAQASELAKTHPRPNRVDVFEAQKLLSDFGGRVTNESCENTMKPEILVSKGNAERVLEQEEAGKREYDKRVKPYAIKTLLDIGASGIGSAIILATWWKEEKRTTM